MKEDIGRPRMRWLMEQAVIQRERKRNYNDYKEEIAIFSLASPLWTCTDKKSYYGLGKPEKKIATSKQERV